MINQDPTNVSRIDLTVQDEIKLYTNQSNYIHITNQQLTQKSTQGFTTNLGSQFDIKNNADETVLQIDDNNIYLKKQVYIEGQVQSINNSSLQSGLVNKGYIDEQITDIYSEINKNQDENKDMMNYRIINCGQPINENDVTTKAFCQNQYQQKSINLQDIIVRADQNISVNNNRIQNVSNGIQNNDAVNYGQMISSIQKVFVQNSCQKISLQYQPDKSIQLVQLQNYNGLNIINNNNNLQSQPGQVLFLFLQLEFQIQQISGTSYLQIKKNGGETDRFLLNKQLLQPLEQVRSQFIFKAIISSQSDEYSLHIIDDQDDFYNIQQSSSLVVFNMQ